MLETQLKEVEAKIQAACDRAGRKREEVTLIAVSKDKTDRNAPGSLRSRCPCVW